MKISIVTENAVPIYEQIVDQIKSEIIHQTITAHAQMPSIRLLAKDLKVSVITTKRAYEELERAGFIYTVPGKGSYVAEISHEKLENVAWQAIDAHIDAIHKIAKDSNIDMKAIIDRLRRVL